MRTPWVGRGYGFEGHKLKVGKQGLVKQEGSTLGTTANEGDLFGAPRSRLNFSIFWRPAGTLRRHCRSSSLGSDSLAWHVWRGAGVQRL